MTSRSHPSPPSEPELMLMQIDLKTLLQHYEKLQSEIHEAELQLALVEAGALDPAVAEAKRAVAETENARPEVVEHARRRYSEYKQVEVERLKARHHVLLARAYETREKASTLAKELARRTKDAPLSHPQPQFSTPQG